MKTCARYRESIALLAAASLEARETAEVKRHLEQCPSCRAYFQETSVLCDSHTTASRQLPSEEVSPRIYARVASAIRGRDPRSMPGSGIPLWLRIASVAAVVLMIAGWFALLHRPTPPTQIAGELTPEPERKGEPDTVSANLITYRLALNRSPEALDQLLNHEAARSNFSSEPSFRITMARSSLDP
ncbi:MAG: hypothetical protein EXS31_04815 [Pedosphaera sp.]|nr:hypothetical protein [Pedosphaera sp.]